MPAIFGWDDGAPKAAKMPPLFYFMLLLTIVGFYLSNSYSVELTEFLSSGKWVPQIAVTLVAAYMLYSRPSPTMPITLLLPMLALLIVATVGIWTSINPSYSALAYVTILGTVVGGYFISALIVATNTRRAYFDLLAMLGRVVIIATILFAVAGLNLGRGAGLTAWSDNPNTLALIMCPSLVVFMAGCIERRPGWPFWHGAFFIIGFYLVWATNSRASAIWIGISLAAFWIYRRGPGFTAFAAIIGLIILIGWWYPLKEFVIDVLGLRWSSRNIGISPLSGREEVWRIGWELFKERPLTGYGLGSSQDLIRHDSWKFVRHQGLHFHSSYIMTAVELGIFGLIAMGTILVVTLGRAIAHSGRTRVLPREHWPLAALPFALIAGSLGHAVFESWLLAAGNANMLLFWTWVWMVHHQAQVKIRAVIVREDEPSAPIPVRAAPARPITPGAPLPAR